MNDPASPTRPLDPLMRLYLWLLLGDGAITALAMGLAFTLHTSALLWVGLFTSFAVSTGAFLLYILLGFTRLLSWRRDGLGILFPFWASTLTAPLVLRLGSDLALSDWLRRDAGTLSSRAPGLLAFTAAMGLAQMLVARFSLRRLSPAAVPTQPTPGEPVATAPTPIFSLRRAAAFVLANVVVLAVGTPVYVYVCGVEGINAIGRGYVTCDGEEVRAATRDLVKDGRTVRLVGMAHVALRGSYGDLVRSIPAEGSVLLAEGVSDRKGRLRHKTTYKRAASTLGLETQAEAFHPQEAGLEVQPADVDAEVFSEESVDLLNAIFALHERPPGEPLDPQQLVKLQLRMSDPRAVEGLLRDILEKRNDHLLARIEEAIQTHRLVVVPWGALHLPDIERALLAKGYKVVRDEGRVVLRLPEVWRALRGEAEEGASAGGTGASGGTGPTGAGSTGASAGRKP